MFKVSNSRINLWRRCHYAHYLKYVKGLQRKVKAAALQRGSIIHECIEAYHNGKSWKKPFKKFKEDFYKNTFEEERVELGDLPTMVEELLLNYFHYYQDEELEYIQNELHFVLPLPGSKEIFLEGYVDALTEDPKGKLWPKETKTYARLPDRDFLLFNNQSGIYIWALQELGHKVEGMMWDIVKAKEPSKPKLTAKTQQLSQAKLDSTPLTVSRGIKELGLNPEDYQDFINSHSFDNYLVREYIRLNSNVVKSIMEDTTNTALDIYKRGETTKDRNLGKDCSWCSYKSICQAELMGLDTDYIIQVEYEQRGGREIEQKEKEQKPRKHRNRK